MRQKQQINKHEKKMSTSQPQIALSLEALTTNVRNTSTQCRNAVNIACNYICNELMKATPLRNLTLNLSNKRPYSYSTSWRLGTSCIWRLLAWTSNCKLQLFQSNTEDVSMVCYGFFTFGVSLEVFLESSVFCTRERNNYFLTLSQNKFLVI